MNGRGADDFRRAFCEGCAFADSGRDSRSRRFYRVDRRFGIEGALDPRRETTSSQKNGWAANRATHGAGRAVILPFTRIGPTASATPFNKRHS